MTPMLNIRLLYTLILLVGWKTKLGEQNSVFLLNGIGHWYLATGQHMPNPPISNEGTVCVTYYGSIIRNPSQIAKFMGPTWDPPGSCRPQLGPMLVPCWPHEFCYQGCHQKELSCWWATAISRGAPQSQSCSHHAPCKFVCSPGLLGLDTYQVDGSKGGLVELQFTCLAKRSDLYIWDELKGPMWSYDFYSSDYDG